MNALTLTQPWATLVALGAKRIETRSWARRGIEEKPLAIHAAKGFPRFAQNLCNEAGLINLALREGRENMCIAGAGALSKILPLSVVVATRILPITSFKTIQIQAREYCGIEITDDEEAFGDYGPERFAWVLTDVVALRTPTEARGSLGIWDWKVYA